MLIRMLSCVKRLLKTTGISTSISSKSRASQTKIDSADIIKIKIYCRNMSQRPPLSFQCSDCLANGLTDLARWTFMNIQSKGRLRATIFKSAEAVHLILLCYLGDAIRWAVTADFKMVARSRPLIRPNGVVLILP